MDARIALLSGAAFLGVVGVGLVAAQRSDAPRDTAGGAALQAPATDVSGSPSTTSWRDDEEEDDDEHEEHEGRKHGEHDGEHEDDD